MLQAPMLTAAEKDQNPANGNKIYDSNGGDNSTKNSRNGVNKGCVKGSGSQVKTDSTEGMQNMHGNIHSTYMDDEAISEIIVNDSKRKRLSQSEVAQKETKQMEIGFSRNDDGLFSTNHIETGPAG
ncbi:MAG: hypothetical protein Q8881_02550 [Sweet potato little leaf phytoplasma]|nr:hypothetical protein [Sweet potato little leaf phytoplasma]